MIEVDCAVLEVDLVPLEFEDCTHSRPSRDRQDDEHAHMRRADVLQ